MAPDRRIRATAPASSKPLCCKVVDFFEFTTLIDFQTPENPTALARHVVGRDGPCLPIPGARGTTSFSRPEPILAARTQPNRGGTPPHPRNTLRARAKFSRHRLDATPPIAASSPLLIVSTRRGSPVASDNKRDAVPQPAACEHVSEAPVLAKGIRTRSRPEVTESYSVRHPSPRA